MPKDSTQQDITPVQGGTTRRSAKARKNVSSGGAFEDVFGYSRAVSYGDHVHVSGTCAPASCEKQTAYLQARAIFKTIETALAEAGSSFDEVVRTTVFLRDIYDAEEVARAHCEVFGDIRPASTLVQVVSMMRPWQKVEIEAYAQRTSARKGISSGGAFEGVYGYSRAFATSDHVHVSGTCAPAGYEKSGPYIQAKAIFETIEKALAEGGASFSDVVRTVVYLRDINDAEEVARAHCEVFGDVRPASTLVQVVSMMRPWQKVEIEAYAQLG
ncbi:Rid family hydrolase [Roseovarius nitratireducens]|uniref:Rid family hydrolase n=1 Tax=Roseovarius nitratireducens TaxID=2044597 RepID=UPI00197DDAC6|nr:Rid family hydrolase [Roseovarius nitratireducens]